MSTRGALRLVAAMLACACGPSTSTPADTDDDTDTDDGTDTSDAPGSGDASSTGDDTQTDTGAPACEPRTGAAIEWEHDAGDEVLPAAGRGDVAVAIDGAGRVLVATTDLTEDDFDVLVSQLDPGGTLRWSLRYEGPAGLDDDLLGLAVDPGGLAYVAVREQTRELIAEGFGNVSEHDVVLLAIDADGGKRWRYARGIPPGPYGENVRVGDIAITPSGDVILVDADVNTGGTPPSLLRLDRFGNELLRADLPTDVEDVARLRITVTPDDATWVAAAAWSENRILRLDSAAMIDVDESFGGDVFFTALAAGPENETYILGGIGDPEAGDGGLTLSRYEPDGTIAWTQTLTFSTGAGYPAGVVVDCDGSPIVAAELEAYPMRTAWLTAFTPAGDPSWSAELPEAGNAAPRSIARGPDGALAIGGLVGTTNTLTPWLAHLR